MGPAVCDAVEGGAFDLYNGTIQGTFVKVEKDKLLVQKWKMAAWDEYSDVTITFEAEEEDVTVINVDQINIPTHDKFGSYVHFDSLEAGWRGNIFERIQKVFGYNLRA